MCGGDVLVESAPMSVKHVLTQIRIRGNHMDDKAKLKTVNHFFKVQGKSTNRCLDPSESCDQPAIRAHSIPGGTVLDRIAENGHVVMPQLKLSVPPPAEIEFKSVGRNKATTFTGLCSSHDNNIFRPIDDALPDPADTSHLFLLAYRAVLREYHVCLQNGLRFQSTYQKRVEVGLSPGDEPCDFGMFATAHLGNAFECYEYKRHFDRWFLASEWQQLDHHVIVLEKQPATVAVCSMFSLDDVDAPETPRVTLSIYPSGDDVVVVFSATSSDASFVAAYLDRILRSDGQFQKYLLSKLILHSCDNFVMVPSYYDSLPQDQKDAICQFYVDTIQVNAEDHEDQRLYLF
jgi:hypothetical protein